MLDAALSMGQHGDWNLLRLLQLATKVNMDSVREACLNAVADNFNKFARCVRCGPYLSAEYGPRNMPGRQAGLNLQLTSHTCLQLPLCALSRRANGCHPQIHAKWHCDCICPRRNFPCGMFTSSCCSCRDTKNQGLINHFIILHCREAGADKLANLDTSTLVTLLKKQALHARVRDAVVQTYPFCSASWGGSQCCCQGMRL